jgi:hypothetical protein
MVDEFKLRTALLSEMAALMLEIDDPQNAFTVWTKTGSSLMHLGGGPNFNDAMVVARKHSLMKDVIILSIDPKYGSNGLTPIPDDERVEQPRAAHAGSGY